MTQGPTDPQKQKPHMTVYWTTVTYRTVIMYVSILLGVAIGITVWAAPEWSMSVLRRISEAVSAGTSTANVPTTNQARFSNLSGRVQVKKANSTAWANADTGMTLDRGDLIQTGGDSNARISFADGTSYLVKSDTLITVEENSMKEDRSTRIGVFISTGAVDLSTPAWQGTGSEAAVSFADARAAAAGNTRLSARTDPTTNQHEVTVSEGTAELERPNDRVTLGQWDKASFKGDGPIVRTRVLAPPELLRPLNLQPLMVPSRAPIQFEWKRVPGAAAYQMRISQNSMFTQVVADRRTTSPAATVSGLSAGDYFWEVVAIDSSNQASEASPTYRFTLAGTAGGGDMLLEVISTQLHGNVVEVVGRTEPGATVIINGEAVGKIEPDGRFKHFTRPLGRGTQTISVSAQNRRGGTASVRENVIIP